MFLPISEHVLFIALKVLKHNLHNRYKIKARYNNVRVNTQKKINANPPLPTHTYTHTQAK